MFYLARLPNQDEISLNLAMAHLNKFSFFDVKHENEIPLGKKYAVFLDVTRDMIMIPAENNYRYEWIIFGDGDPSKKNTVKTHFEIPERVWLDSAKGLVHWIISFPQESDTEERIMFDKLMVALNVSKSRNITFLTGCNFDTQYKNYFETKYDINLAFYNVLFEYVGIQTNIQKNIDMVGKNVQTNILSIHRKDKRRFKGVMYNRMKRNHRLFFLAKLKKNNMLDDTIWSCGVGHVGEWIDQFTDMKAEMNYFANLENRSAEESTNHNKLNLNDNHANTVNFDHGRMSYLHIVSESNTTNRTFITEKSYKPFFMMQPFVMVGNYGNVQTLKDMGYNVFEEWIDHSYDTENDEVKRWEKAFEETKRLYSLSPEQWSDMMVCMSDAILHNVSAAMTPQIHKTSDIINILINFYINRV